MSSYLQQKFHQAGRYFHFLSSASNHYSVHSPFVYKLVSEVIKPGSPQAVCGPVEALRERLLHDRSSILKTDFGSGSAGGEMSQHSVRISRLARSSTVPAYRAARLFYLVKYFKAYKILELGTSLGISAAYLAKANPAARVVTMEGCPELYSLASHHMNELGLANVEVVEGSFDKTLDGVLNSFDQLDLVFFDGNHRKAPTLEYFQKCLPKSHNGTVFVFDDIHYSEEMEEAWEAIKSHPDVRISIDLFHMGWVIFREELSRQHFTLRYP